jgi:hypothetical protein
MSLDDLFVLAGSDASGGFLVKTFILIGLFLYLIFALVVVKQVNQMTDVLEVGFETPVRILVLIHLVFALVTLLIAFVIL